LGLLPLPPPLLSPRLLGVVAPSLALLVAARPVLALPAWLTDGWDEEGAEGEEAV
jgi:hypothetical protein